MTELGNHNKPVDPTSNIYFQNKRIRTVLLKAGLINERGEVLPLAHSKPVSIQRRRRKHQVIKEKSSEPTQICALEEEQSGQVHANSQSVTSVKHVTIEQNQERKQRQKKKLSSLSHLRNAPTSTQPQDQTLTRAKSANRLSRGSKKRHDSQQSPRPKPPCKDRSQVTMIYYGQHTNIHYDITWLQPDGDEIIVSQQHCGGENLIVFKGYVKPNEKFQFFSRRHPDYPFALAFYVNGLIVNRVSVCCESKHKHNVPLGGKNGFFGIVDVKQVEPCRSCKYKILKKKSRSAITLELGPSRYQKSTVPCFPPIIRSHSLVNKEIVSSSSTESKAEVLSPVISRTPSPSLLESETEPPIHSSHHSLSLGQNLQSQPIPASSTGNNNANYSSDFEDNNDDDALQRSSSNFSRPRISDLQLTENESDSNQFSKVSLGNSKDYTTTIQEDKHHVSKITVQRKDIVSHSRQSSSSSSRKSDRSTDKNDHDLSKKLIKRNDDTDSSSTSSRKISTKPVSPPRYEVKREVNEKTTNLTSDTQLSSASALKNNKKGRRSSSSSEDDAFKSLFVKKSETTYHPSDVRQVSTTEPKDIFQTEPSSSSRKVTRTQDLFNTLFNTNTKTNENNNKSNFYSDEEKQLWRKDSDEDGT